MWCTMTVSVAEPVYGTEVIRVLVPGDEEDLDEYEVAAALQAAQDSVADSNGKSCQACCGKHCKHTCARAKAAVTKPVESCQACCGKHCKHTCARAQPAVTKPVVTKPAVSESAVDLSQRQSDTRSGGYTNVYKRKSNGRFEACPVFNGTKHFIGTYDTAEEAAMVVARFLISKGKSPPANKIAVARPQNSQLVQLQCTVQKTEALVTPVALCSQMYDTEGGMYGCTLPAFHSGEHSTPAGESNKRPRTTETAAALVVPKEASRDKDQWIQCDSCDKWRKLINGTAKLPEDQRWYCTDNNDTAHNRCQHAEEESDVSDSESDDADDPAQDEEQHKAPVNDSVIKLTEPVVTAVLEPVIDLSQWRSDRCSSGYQGVYTNKRRGTFEAWCNTSRAKRYLGTYATAEEAAMVVARTTISKAAPLPTSSEVPAVVATQISQIPGHNTVTPNAEIAEAVAEDTPDEVTQRVAAGTLLLPDAIAKSCPTKPVSKYAKPSFEEWQCSGHPWISQRVLCLFGDRKVSGVVTGWIPASTADLTAMDPSLFHVVHDDGECA